MDFSNNVVANKVFGFQIRPKEGSASRVNKKHVEWTNNYTKACSRHVSMNFKALHLILSFSLVDMEPKKFESLSQASLIFLDMFF